MTKVILERAKNDLEAQARKVLVEEKERYLAETKPQLDAFVAATVQSYNQGVQELAKCRDEAIAAKRAEFDASANAHAEVKAAAIVAQAAKLAEMIADCSEE